MPQPYGLHAYQPVLIDESCLTDEDRREAFEEALRAPAIGEAGGDWRSYATPQERARLEKELAELRRTWPPFAIANGEVPELREKRFELARRCRLRAFARKKYSGGRPVWFGDGVPIRSPS
jgi:hypothetical protein